ncbi:uncharacterized protein PHALS_15318 [Plasmopara halstedii]|uniref:Uncharacterized protein n=1 Tax=Plasmopara halstedii TaxID=4781 RepID=A0A0P1ADC2_PLAHL|nr:uncharacterized protein PHALS_15318 [Plasmopara halstedii]CEG38522.1 hypothetical protein PHALS_15318 [Plasmopara halstedii]|eukprot:XP_024574891.1 hypothetical protein PHALS_15318 [Plasmopara halstedii]
MLEAQTRQSDQKNKMKGIRTRILQEAYKSQVAKIYICDKRSKGTANCTLHFEQPFRILGHSNLSTTSNCFIYFSVSSI